jgi:ABC-2 type transport system permease protein
MTRISEPDAGRASVGRSGAGRSGAGWFGAGRSAVVLAEWTKLRTVRSTWLMLAVAAVVSVVVGAIAAAQTSANAADPATADTVGASLGGLLISQLVFAVIGALVVTAEYATGTMRTTLTAVPRRGTVLMAKAVVVGGFALVFGQTIAFAAYFAGWWALPSGHSRSGLMAPGVLRSVTGAGCYLLVMAMIGFGLGVIIRHTAGTLAAIGLVFVQPLLARYLLPDSSPLGNYVLWWAAQAMTSPEHRAHYPSAGWSFAVCVGYALLVLLPAVVLFLRRDDA